MEELSVQYKKLEEILDEYDKKVHLQIDINPEIDKILCLKQEFIQKLSREECFTYAFILAQYAGAIQKEFNRQSSKIKWTEEKLNLLIASEYNNYGTQYTKFEIKRAMIINDNEYGKMLHQIIINGFIKTEELNFIASRIHTMSETLKEYGKSKRE